MEYLEQIFEAHFIRDDLLQLLLQMKPDNIYDNKFKCLQKVLSNIFLNEEKKEEILDTFCHIQRFIYAILRLKRIWKWNRANTYNTEDLYMNPIQEGQRNTITLLQNNTKYIFQIRELIGSINNSLSNSCHFFVEPLVCKNPYTNLPFDKASLYNIYFAVRASTFIMPTLLHQYFLSDFHLSYFGIMNQHMMNQEYLRTYVDNNCAQDVIEIVNDMFDDHKLKIKISKDFPKDKLFAIMKPYLRMYFVSNYSLNEFKKRLKFRILHKKLHDFFTFNPQFGRRKIRMVDIKPFSKSKKIEYYFDDKHIDFNESLDCQKEAKNFMKSHLCKNEFCNINSFFERSIINHQRPNRHFIVADESDSEEEEEEEEEEDEEEEEEEELENQQTNTPIISEEHQEVDNQPVSESEYEYPDSDSESEQEYNFEGEQQEQYDTDSDANILEDSDTE
jgi:hypothetical protein